MKRRSSSHDSLGGLPDNLVSRLAPPPPPPQRSNSLTALHQRGATTPHKTLGSLNLPRRRSTSFNQLPHIPSLSSIQEEEGKRLQWGYVEEFGWNSDVEEEDTSSRASQAGDQEDETEDDEDTEGVDSSSSSSQAEEEEEEEEDDGWGWYPEEDMPAASSSRRRTLSQPDEDHLAPPAPPPPPPPPPPAKPPRRNRSSILRSFGGPTPLDPGNAPMYPPASPTAYNNNNALLILGTKHWPQRSDQQRRRGGGGGAGGILSLSTYSSTPPVLTTAPASAATPVSPSSPASPAFWDPPVPLLTSLVCEARAKKHPLQVSTVLILARGMGTGFAMRAVPNALFRAVSWSYYHGHAATAASNYGEAVRTGLFLGLTMATLHVFALTNVKEEEDEEEDSADEDDSSDDDDEDAPPPSRRPPLPWPPVAAAVMTPLLGLLPRKSRLSMALYVSARAVEAALNGALSRLSPQLRQQLPLSQWLYSLGIAQVVYIWLFHRQALPQELAAFMDAASSVRVVDLTSSFEEIRLVWAGRVDRAPLGKRVLFGSGVVEFIASDVFSAASLFGPVFDVKSSSTALASLGKSSRAALALILSALFSRVALVALTKLLRRFSPSNGFWAGFVAAMFAIQVEREDVRRIELAMFSLTFAARAVFNLAALRNIVPAEVKWGEFALYFASLVGVLSAATSTSGNHNKRGGGGRLRMRDRHQPPPPRSSSSSRLVLGATFRLLLRRCIVP